MKRRMIFGLLLLFGILLCACGLQKTEQDEEIAAPMETAAASDPGNLIITELMAKNHTTITDENGRFSDWAEIKNIDSVVLSLKGWSISDGRRSHRQALPEISLGPGEYYVAFCESFGIAEGEAMVLYDPEGNERDRVLCESIREDFSLARQEDGSFAETVWISPGFPNGKEGYDSWCEQNAVPTGLTINEAMVSNQQHPDEKGQLCDWIEVKNNSDEELDLSGYSLSEDREGTELWQFPEEILQPGEIRVFDCDEDSPASDTNTGFSLSAVTESLYLFDGSGMLTDHIFLHDIPREGSSGRLTGKPGVFYFQEPSRGEENQNGKRRVSDLPVSLTAEGSYNDVGSVRVELWAEGTIYYTLDGSLPTEVSYAYTGPIELSETGVIRAVSVEENALPGRTATFSFFLNENHVFPILSLVTEEKAAFEKMYNFGYKYQYIPANLALYEDGVRFNRECELSMKGWTSLSLPKKSMGVEFKGRYGGNLDCDVFGNGITEYQSLSIRAGQDYNFSMFRNELFQELCLEASDSLLTQESKYCVLYVNGKYYGIYCLKEDFSRQYYASHAGVSVESVEGFRAPATLGSDYYKLVTEFAWAADMTQEENYRYICDNINLDSLIDWFLFEAWCANTDTQGNLRVYRSSENGNRWEYVFYDLDWGLWYNEGNFRILISGIGNVGSEMPLLLRSLLKNDEFRDRVLTRYAELVDTVFSDDYVLEKIDEYEQMLMPEMPRDRERWYLTMDSWRERVELLRSIIRKGYADYTIDTLCIVLNLTEEERIHYFG